MSQVIPTLETERILIRPFSLADAPNVQKIANVREIADNTLAIPHPYTIADALDWISGHQSSYELDTSVEFALEERLSGNLCGAMGLMINRTHNHAEFGYWLGVDYWNRGYMTEAAHAICSYAFTTMGLERIQACHFINNPASGRVMQKLGMAFEGVRRHYYLKNGEYIDIALYGVLREDWNQPE